MVQVITAGLRDRDGDKTGTGTRKRMGMQTGMRRGADIGSGLIPPAHPGTHRCRGDRGLAEEPLGLLELAVPAVVFAVGVPETETGAMAGPAGRRRGWGGGQVGSNSSTHFWLVR